MKITILICVAVSISLNGLSGLPQLSEEEMMAEFLRRLPSSSSHRLGGRLAEPGEIPYILSVQWDGKHFCGASIIETPSGDHVAVTAGHCVNFDGSSLIPTSKLTVTGGALIINNGNTEPTSQTLRVRKIVAHQRFHYNHLDIPVNDIAILFLHGKFQVFSDKLVEPLALPSSNHNAPESNSKVQVSGWGFLTDEQSEHLRVVELNLLDNDECAKKYAAIFGDESAIRSTNICAGEDDGGKDTCQGDSGGPMTDLKNSTSRLLLGITSWGIGCARPNVPGVYTRVSSYVDWIAQQVVQ